MISASKKWGGVVSSQSKVVNLLRDASPSQVSDHKAGFPNWTIGSGGNGVGKVINLPGNYNAIHGFEIDENTTGNSDFCQPGNRFKKGTYTFAVTGWVPNDSKVAEIPGMLRIWSSTKRYMTKEIKLTKTAQRFVATFDTTNWAELENMSVQFGIHLTATGNKVCFAEPMLEEGSTAHDFVPPVSDDPTRYRKFPVVVVP